MARISVDSSAVSHNKNGEGGGVTYVMGGSSKSGSYNSLTVQSINAANGNIDYLKSKSISANDMSMIYISAVDGTIQKLKGSSANFDQGYFSALGADTIDANKLTVKDIDAINAWIETLQSKEITTEYLTVTKQAHFFELIIDKIRSVGGQLIITPASCTVDYVWGVDSNDNLVPADTPDVDAYEIYWRATQNDGRTVTNDWIVNDQAICQSFNNVHQEENYNISNKYYWRLVTAKPDDIYVNLSTGALTTDPNASLKNEFEVIMYKTTSILDNQVYDNNISWECKAQTILDDEGHEIIPTNVNWNDMTLDTDEVVHGIFKSASQLYGIQIEPTITENLPATTNFQLQIKQKGADDTYSIIPEKINIAVYFTDDTFLMWNDAPLDANGNFFFNMPDANSAIKSIIVTSTADVKWHLCHRIRLSNADGEMDPVLDTSAAIPGAGDNVIQLGYQGNDDPKRQSAIIIAAYMTPDAGLTCPSYAHYIGINDFHLSDHRHSYFDANGAKFLGDITLANVGDMTAKDKWMKLNVASSPIEIFYTNNTRGGIGPTKYSLTITTINNNGETVTLTSVPTGYKVFIYYYDLQGKLNYGPDSVSAGSSLSNLTAPNTVEINNNTTYVYKIECILVKGNSATDKIIDKASIEYGMFTYFNTDSWCLIPKKEVAYATILDAYNAPTTTANDQRVKLYVSLQYGIGHYVYGAIENGQFDYDASTNPNGFRLVAHVYYQSFGNGVMAEFTNNNITWTKSVNNTICTFEVANYLQTLHNNQYLDYMDNYKNNRQKNPVMIQVELVKGSEVLDSRTVYVSMQSGAIQKLTDNSWVSAISYTDGKISNNISLIEQTATGIRTWVSENYATTGEAEQLESSIEQTAGMIRTEVRRDYGNSAYHIDSSNSYWTMIDTDTDDFDADKYYLVNVSYRTTYPRKYMYTFQAENESNENFNLMLNVTYISASDGNWVGGNKYVNEYYLQNADIVIGDVAEDTNAWEMKFYVRGKHKYIFRCPETFYACGYLYNTDNQHIYPDPTQVHNSVTEPQNYRPTESSIEQTAERISLSVMELDGVSQEQLKRTGIDITNGKIELNAENTNINGNLNLRNAETGFTLYDDSGNARVNITASDTPDPTSADGGFIVYSTIELASDPINKSPSSGATATTSKKLLGTFSTGDNLNMTVYPKISGITRDATKIVQDNIPYPLTCRVNLYYHGGSTVVYTSGDKYVSRNGTAQTGYYYSSFSWDLTNVNAGTYDIEFKITSAPESANGYTVYWISSIVDYSKITESLTYVGLDGVLIGTSSKHFAKISKDGFEFRWIGANDPKDGYGIKINNDGIMRPYKINATNGTTSWVAFDGYSKATVLKPEKWTKTNFYLGDTQITNKYSYVVQPNDTSIFVPHGFSKDNESEFYIRLCDGAGNTTIENHETDVPAGRKLIIRNLSDKTVYVCPGLSSNVSHPNNTTRTATQNILNRASDGGDFMTDFNMNGFSYTMMTIPYRHSATQDANWAIMHRD